MKNFNYFFEQPLFRGIYGLHVISSPELNLALPTVLIVVGPSGGGKDTVLRDLFTDGTLVHAVTSTTRRRRYEFADDVSADKRFQIHQQLENLTDGAYLDCLDELGKEPGLLKYLESRDAYLWLRSRKPEEEDDVVYLQHLIDEYDLIESDIHHGNIYGLPKANLYAAAQKPGLTVIRTEPTGAKTLLQKLSVEFNVVVLGVVPDSPEVVKARIFARVEQSGKGDENPELRFNESMVWVDGFPALVHLVLHNTEKNVNYPGLDEPIKGLEASVLSLRALAQQLKP